MTAAVYIRKSREEAGKPSHRLTVQREQLPAHAKAQGWQVAIYDDGHASAARGKVEDLRERARLEADIRAGRIDVVLCIELSRLSRDDSLQDYVAWLHLCADQGVKLATPSRTLDPQQPSDWMLLLMEGGFSSVEMKILRKRMADGRQQALIEGRYLSGNPPAPYRYDRTNRGLVIDQPLLPVVTRMLTLCETLGTRDVSEQIGWPVITVRRAITDDRLLFYQGKRRHPQTGEIIDGQWPAIIDAAQAERIKAGRRYRRAAPKREAGGLLTNLGIFTCGYCGRSIRSWKGRVLKSGSRIDRYGCKANEHRRLCDPSRMIPQPDIDDRLQENLINTLGRIAEIRRTWYASQGDTDTAATLQALEQQSNHLLQRKQRIVAAIADGVIDFSDARQQRQQIDGELEQIAARRTRALTALSPEPDWAALTFTRDEYAVLTTDEQREVIALAIERIRLYSAYLLIDYRFPRDNTGNTTARVHLPPPQRPRQ